MLTYGYIRDSVQAHLDLTEQETQAMNLQSRYHIYANEAMQAICGTKPKYDYFKAKAVFTYDPIINEGDNKFRPATEDDINWSARGLPEPNFADEVDTKKWYEGQNIYLLDTPVRMPDDFVAFANKQAWAFIMPNSYKSELFVTNYYDYALKPRYDYALKPRSAKLEPVKTKATKSMFSYTGSNTITFLKEGEYHIPYKAIWFKFKSGITDGVEIDMPIDILVTIPIYIAAQCLQMDHAQRAAAKRAEFELALSRVHNTDFLANISVSSTF